MRGSESATQVKLDFKFSVSLKVYLSVNYVIDLGVDVEENIWERCSTLVFVLAYCEVGKLCFTDLGFDISIEYSVLMQF